MARLRPAEDAPFVRVWKLVKRIPRGRVATYGQLSRMIERRLTPIAIGWAMRAAPEGAIPWHRVVNATGGLSTDREHPGLQRALLEAEGVQFGRDGTIDLKRYAWAPRPGRAGRAGRAAPR
jgi:methylated-DNA-protein-cysteine methyltransferase-like protein